MNRNLCVLCANDTNENARAYIIFAEISPVWKIKLRNACVASSSFDSSVRTFSKRQWYDWAVENRQMSYTFLTLITRFNISLYLEPNSTLDAIDKCSCVLPIAYNHSQKSL